MISYVIPEDMKTELNQLTREADSLLTKFNSGFVCKEGCSGCCETFTWNFIEIAKIQESCLSGDVSKKLRKRIPSYNREFYKRKKELGQAAKDYDTFCDCFKELRCVFLYDNRCLVYENRPLLCRLFGSRDSRKCTGTLELSQEYHDRATHILQRVMLLNSRFTQLYFPGCTLVSLPFRFLE